MEQAVNESVVISRVERPNSYEFGKAGNRFKIYFDKPHDLKALIKELTDEGLYEETTTSQTPII